MINDLKLSDPQIKALTALLQQGAMFRGLTCYDLYTFKGHVRDFACVPGTVIKVLERHKLIHKIADTTQTKIYSITRAGKEYLEAMQEWEKTQGVQG